MLLEENKDKLIFFVILLGLFIGVLFLGSFSNQTNFGDAALGNGTVSHFAKDREGNSIHYLPKENANEFLEGIHRYQDYRKVFFLGNSQSHSINQMEDRDNTMSGFLFEELLEDSILFISASIPNANLQEHYLLFEFFTERIENIELLILPVFYDDLREDGIREAYFKNFADGKFKIDQENEAAQTINKFLKKNYTKSSDTIVKVESLKGTADSEFKALEETTQDIVEKKLNQLLYDRFGFWKNREELRGDFFTKLYLARNTALNISAQTTRNMIPARYQRNINALQTILSESVNDSVEVLLLVPPLRTDIKYPYNEGQYLDFKKKLKSLASNNVMCVDFEAVVDPMYWGYSAPTQLFQSKDYDFMHFQAEGHRVLADSIKPYIFSLLR